MIQHPSRRPQSHILLHSDIGGSGKNVLTSILQCLIGWDLSTANAHVKRILCEDGFTEGTENVLIIMDEVDPNFLNDAQLKNLCTRHTVVLNKKYRDGTERLNHTHIICSSNDPPVGWRCLKPGQRRCFFETVSPYWSVEMAPDRNKEFVDKLLALYGENGKWEIKPGEFNDEQLCKIGSFFMSYNLQNFNPCKPEKSKAMLAAEASSQTLESHFFATVATTERIDSGDKPESSIEKLRDPESRPETHTITVDALFKHFNNWVERNGLQKTNRHSKADFVRNSFQSHLSPLKKIKGFLAPG